GAEIYTMDGEKLGTVKAVRAECFQVDAPMQRDYWLRADCVDGGSYGSDRVTVSFNKDHVDDFKQQMDDKED
ncbi:MAG: PRC-barrel domain-containing protein, partial [Tepidiformaceae bacterium]